MQDLRVVLLQSVLVWEDASANLARFEKVIKRNSGETDLIILPEMFNTGFTMHTAKCAEEMSGTSVTWMRKQAAEFQVAILGSLIIKEAGECYNRCICMLPNGEHHQYDKRHLFRMGNEHKHFSAGKNRNVFELKGWRICMQICYDLRFPVWSRNTNDYDVLIYVANWPEKRIAQWQRLLQARAIENQCYVLAVNRVGDDGNGIPYSGSTGVIDFQGDWLEHEYDIEVAIAYQLNYSQLEKWREVFPVAKDADAFHLD